MVVCIVLGSILWGDCSNSLLWLALFITVSFGVIGFYDDWLKIARQNTRGLSAKAKMAWQMLLVLMVSIYFYTHDVYAHNMAIFFAEYASSVECGLFVYPLDFPGYCWV